MRPCPRGCDAFMEYMGIDDGFGMNGELSCEFWECPICGESEIGDCLECDDEDESTDEVIGLREASGGRK